MFAQMPNYAPPILQARNRDPRLAYFQALQQAGASTAPVQSPLEGVARVAQAGIGGYFGGKVNSEYEDRQKKYQDAMTKALAENDPIAALQLSGNADVMSQFGPQILQAKQQAVQRAEDRAARTEERKDTQGFQIKMAEAAQNFQAAQGELQRAHAAVMQSNTFENQRALQEAQQKFTAAQTQAQQLFTADQQQKAQGFQAGENALNRAAQVQASEPQRALTGLKIKEEEQKIVDNAKSKEEAIVSTERMIRSIDELSGHRGLEGAVGAPSLGKVLGMVPGTDEASFKVRLETLKSQAFLPMVAQLKGMGQLSDAEGKKLTAAIGALDTAMSESEFKASMKEIKGDLEAALKRMGKTPAAATGEWKIEKVQ